MLSAKPFIDLLKGSRNDFLNLKFQLPWMGSMERLYVVICEETWEETSRTTMVGFHHLMQIGRFINVLLAQSEILEKKVTVLGINGLLAYIFKACTADVLDLNRITSIVDDNSYQWRLAS